MQQQADADKATAKATNAGRPNNRPVHTIRYGTVRAAVWRNVVDLGAASREMYSVTFSRSYRDVDNQWKDSASFGADDLLVLAKAADEAHTWVTRQRSADAKRAE
jgi:hypothetical protein